MAIDEKQLRLTFQKLDRQLNKTSDDTAPTNVHHLRTHARRVEALLEYCVPEPSGNQKKVVKVLSRLRKKAGRIRDLDVQIAALNNLKIGSDGNRKSQLLRTLAEERSERAKKLAKALAPDELDEVRKRLKRAATIQITTDPLEVAFSKLAQLGTNDGNVTEDLLHQYRIVGKQGRYLAELAGKDARAERLIEVLKRMQDVIGDWHDWLKLAQKAQQRLAGPEYSPLLAALRRVTATKYLTAQNVLKETRAALAAFTSTPKPPARQPASTAARAASGSA